VKVVWPRIAGTSALNDAMLSGSVDLYVAGTPGVLIVWDRTKGRSNAILGCAGVTTLPLSLVTVTDRLKSLADFTEKDRIALPSLAGTPATVIRMACEQAFGPGQHGRLDKNMVALAHPDAMTALLNRSEVTAYLGSPPFTDLVLQDKAARVLLRSPEVFKEPASFVLLSARKAFAERNPRLVAAMVSALETANGMIARNPRAAAETYMEAEPSRSFTVDLIEASLRDPATEFTTKPRAVMRTAEFMHRIGEIRTVPQRWSDVFVAGSERLDGD
jgi:NitT/TauT family transport system substrate-binding protein